MTVSEAPTTTAATPVTAATTTPLSTECSPAAKTARLIEEYKQHAAEWAREQGNDNNQSAEKNFFFTAPLVTDGTDAAFHRFLDACVTQQQVKKVEKKHAQSLIQ